MTPQRWQQIKGIFDEAAEHNPASRAEFVRQRCGGDEELRREVDSLLASDGEEDVLLETSVMGAGAAADLADSSPVQEDSFGSYLPICALGEGGMGTVYLARQEQPIRRDVALKVVKLGMDSRHVLERFEIERQALALMEHPNVARVLDAGTSKLGRPYFVMEYVDGVPITQYCDQKALRTDQRLQLFIPVCQALQHAHKKGIIHRDVKPSNVLVMEVDGKPVPKVIDFGIARATDQRLVERKAFTLAGQIVGTPEYMSPEQAGMDGSDVDTGTDVYSLGVVLYELLVGALPLDMRELRKIAFGEVMRAIRETPVPRPTARITQMGADADVIARQRGTNADQLKRDLSGDLDWIVMKAIDKDRRCRYASASEFAADIDRYLKSEPVLAGPPSAAYRMRKFVTRHKRPVAGAAAVVLALVAGILTTAWEAHVAGQQKTEAVSQRAEAERQRARAEQHAVEATRQAIQAQSATKLAQEESKRANESNRLALARQLAIEASRLAQESPANNSLSALLSIESMMRQPSLIGNQVLNHFLTVTPRQVHFIDHAGAGAVQFSYGGQWIAAARDDNSVGLYEARIGREVRRLAHGDRVWALAFSPDNRWIATGSADKFARVFDTSTGRETSRLAHGDSVVSVAFSADSRLVATASLDQTARVFEAITGNEISRVGHEGRVVSVAFSPDGRRIATGSGDKTARVLETATGKEIARQTYQREVSRVVFSPDGSRVAAAAIKTSVFDAVTGKELSQNYPDDGDVISLAFSPDGRWIADSTTGMMVRVIEAETGKEVSHSRHDGAIAALAFSPDGRWVATASADRTSRVFEAATGRSISDLPHSGRVGCVAFSPDGRLLATGSGELKHAAMRVFEVEASKEIASLAEDRAVEGAVFTADARRLATLSRDGWTRIHDVSTGKELIRLGNRDKKAWPISPDGRLYATRDSRGTEIHDIATGRQLSILTASGPAMAFSANGRQIATILDNGHAQVLDSTTGRKISDAIYPDIVRFTGFTFSPNGRWMASGRYVFDVASGRIVSRYPEGKLNRAYVLAVSADSRLVACRDYFKNVVQVFEAATGNDILNLPQRYRVQAVTFSPDTRWLGVGGDDKVARVVETTTGRELLRFNYPGRVRNVAFSSDSRYLYVLSDTIPPAFGFVYSARGVWLHKQLLNTEELIHEVCSRLPGNLTPEQWNEYLGGAPYRDTCPNLLQPPK